MATSTLADPTWWRHLLERLGRQAAQVALPVVAAAATSAGHIDWRTSAVAIGGALVLTVLKAFAGVTSMDSDPLVWRLVDRAGAAAAGVLVGFVPVDWTGLTAVHWSAVAWAAGSAALTAVLAVYATPAAFTGTPADASGSLA